MKNSIETDAWRDFQQAGLLWWINRILHTFGWAIAFEEDDDGNLIKVYPIHVKYFGYSEKSDEIGLERMKKMMKDFTSD